MMVHFLK